MTYVAPTPTKYATSRTIPPPTIQFSRSSTTSQHGRAYSSGPLKICLSLQCATTFDQIGGSCIALLSSVLDLINRYACFLRYTALFWKSDGGILEGIRSDLKRSVKGAGRECSVTREISGLEISVSRKVEKLGRGEVYLDTTSQIYLRFGKMR